MPARNSPKYFYATCELYNKLKHGIQYENIENIEQHYIVIDSFMCFRSLVIGEYYLKIRRNRLNRIFGLSFNPKIELIEPLFLENGEMVAVIKTMWLSILQRKYKKWFHKNKEQIAKYKNMRKLLNREIGYYAS